MIPKQPVQHVKEEALSFGLMVKLPLSPEVDEVSGRLMRAYLLSGEPALLCMMQE